MSRAHTATDSFTFQEGDYVACAAEHAGVWSYAVFHLKDAVVAERSSDMDAVTALLRAREAVREAIDTEAEDDGRQAVQGEGEPR